MIDLSTKQTVIASVYWVTFTILSLGFVFCGKERFRFDGYDVVLIALYILSAFIFILILI